MPAAIRLATIDDAPTIQAIYAPYVRDTIVSFEYEIPTVEEMRARLEKTLPTHPWIVCEDGQGTVVGYAYAVKHRERAAYQWSTDVSVYASVHRAGVGRGLYQSLFALLKLQGYMNAFAGITMPNDASVGLHRAMGFQLVGVYPKVGYKMGGWHDTSWWSLALAAAHETPTPLLSPAALRGKPEWEMAMQAGVSTIRL